MPKQVGGLVVTIKKRIYIKKQQLYLMFKNLIKMKKLLYSSLVVAVIAVTSCTSGPKREPGTVYMPDMAYSRAFESYPDLDPKIFTDVDSMAGSRIFYNRKPVFGSVKRGQMGVFHFANDSAGKKASGQVKNPIDSSITVLEKKESERLFNIYCAICHGVDMKGQGPLVASGKYSVAAANLMDATKFGRAVYGDGEIFHTLTYGKNSMGSYASQLSNKQRWMVANYIRTKQDAATAAAAPKAGEKPKADTTKKS
jgi:mono/diheme cytochrome c family protein